MLFILGAFVDPATNEFDFGRLQLLMRLGRRHDFVWVFVQHALQNWRFVRVALNDDHVTALGGLESELSTVEAELGLARTSVRPVAVVAILGQDGLDIAVKRDTVGGRSSQRGQQEKGKSGRHRTRGKTNLGPRVFPATLRNKKPLI